MASAAQPVATFSVHNGKIPVSVFTSAPHVFQHIVSRARNNIKVVADIDNTMLFSDKTLKERPLGSSIIKYLTDEHGAEVTYSEFRRMCDETFSLGLAEPEYRALFAELDTDRFFYCVRPYFKPHRVGQHVYRGANAGDFAGINVIDMLLGLCRADHAYYSQLLVDKFLYMMPDDQVILRDCMRRRSLMDEFLALSASERRASPCRENLALFLEVCELHGQTAAQHHDQLVAKFIEQPAEHIGEQHQDNLTASGPPLPVLMRALARLRDLRRAADRRSLTPLKSLSSQRGVWRNRANFCCR